jgi:hypothetical protein
MKKPKPDPLAEPDDGGQFARIMAQLTPTQETA